MSEVADNVVLNLWIWLGTRSKKRSGDEVEVGAYKGWRWSSMWSTRSIESDEYDF